MSEKKIGWQEEIDDGYRWLVLRDERGRLQAVPGSREPAYLSCGKASKPMADMINALTSERDEAVRVAGELRAKAANIRPYLRRPATIVPANLSDDERWRFNAEWVSIYDYRELLAVLDCLTASTGGSSDEPQKEIRE